MTNITLKTHYPNLHKNMRFYTPAPDNLITLYNSRYDQKANKSIYTNIIGYLLIEKDKIVTLDNQKNIIEEFNYIDTRRNIQVDPKKSKREHVIAVEKNIIEKYNARTTYPDETNIGASHTFSIQQPYRGRWIDVYTNKNFKGIIEPKTQIFNFTQRLECLAPTSIEKNFQTQKDSPAFFSDEILNLIELNEQNPFFQKRGEFILQEYKGIIITCTKNGDKQKLYTHQKEEPIRQGFESCGKTEFFRLFFENAGKTAHERIEILSEYQSPKERNDFYENFITKSRKILQSQPKHPTSA